MYFNSSSTTKTNSSLASGNPHQRRRPVSARRASRYRQHLELPPAVPPRGQSVVVSTLQAKFNSTYSVDPDTEMSNLIQLLNVYAANAPIMSAIQEMVGVLFRAQ